MWLPAWHITGLTSLWPLARGAVSLALPLSGCQHSVPLTWRIYWLMQKQPPAFRHRKHPVGRLLHDPALRLSCCVLCHCRAPIPLAVSRHPCLLVIHAPLCVFLSLEQAWTKGHCMAWRIQPAVAQLHVQTCMHGALTQLIVNDPSGTLPNGTGWSRPFRFIKCTSGSTPGWTTPLGLTDVHVCPSH